jgi:hypothetical protein
MLTESHIFPPEPPPGYSYLEHEPTFDPAEDLKLEPPPAIQTLADLGYSATFQANYESTLAVTAPFRLLSESGLDKLHAVIKQLQPFIRSNPKGAGVSVKMRGTAYRSRFIRDLCLSPEVADFLGGLGGVGVVPTSYPHELAQLNFPPVERSRPIVGWHHDKNAFVLVTMLNDPATVDGADLEYFAGTRHEGYEILARSGELPPDRRVMPTFPGAGFAVLMQGSTLLHRATPLLSDSERISMITSYDTRDVRYPDPNRVYFVKGGFGATDPNSSLERKYRYVEYARHMAWRTRGRLADFIEDSPWTDDREKIIEELQFAIEDAVKAIEMLRRGDMTKDEAKQLQEMEDSRLPR